MRLVIYIIAGFIFLSSCTSHPTALPKLGEMNISNGDTVFHQIPSFAFTDQYGDTITEKTIDSKIYVTDFFFTKCPTICPKMSKQMLRLHEKYSGEKNMLLLSHSIDSKYDTTLTLKKYAEKLGVGDTRFWHFLHVPKDQLNAIAREYLASVQKDTLTAGGFTHTGHFILVDGERHIRSFCDGTKPDEVDRLMSDVDLLLREKSN
ncbi:MAG: SCO family protein [Saprospiraceae bacterium]